jgi:hypothetical protein
VQTLVSYFADVFQSAIAVNREQDHAGLVDLDADSQRRLITASKGMAV